MGRSSTPNSAESKPNEGDEQAKPQRERAQAAREKKAEAEAEAKEHAAQKAPETPVIGTPAADENAKAVAASDEMTADFKLGQPAPSDLFAVMNEAGIEDAFSTKPPERGHQLAFKGRVVELEVIHQISHVKAAQA